MGLRAATGIETPDPAALSLVTVRPSYLKVSTDNRTRTVRGPRITRRRSGFKTRYSIDSTDTVHEV